MTAKLTPFIPQVEMSHVMEAAQTPIAIAYAIKFPIMSLITISRSPINQMNAVRAVQITRGERRYVYWPISSP